MVFYGCLYRSHTDLVNSINNKSLLGHLWLYGLYVVLHSFPQIEHVLLMQLCLISRIRQGTIIYLCGNGLWQKPYFRGSHSVRWLSMSHMWLFCQWPCRPFALLNNGNTLWSLQYHFFYVHSSNKSDIPMKICSCVHNAVYIFEKIVVLSPIIMCRFAFPKHCMLVFTCGWMWHGHCVALQPAGGHPDAFAAVIQAVM